jgi:putative tryptophan/tyrosine transport system substrate-binding protein
MRRREFLGALSGAIAWPAIVRAQKPAMPVIGFLGLAPASGSAGRVEAMGAGLREFGFIDGNNVVIEFRWAERPDQLRELAAQLVQRRPDVIVTTGNAATVAAKRETSAIPIVFSVADDPVRLGYVASFSRPGGTLTGVSLISGALGAKRLELLRELMPAAVLIALLTNPNNPAEAGARDEQARASAIGQRLLVVTATDEHQIETAFAQISDKHAQAIVVSADAFFTANRARITALAAQYRIPAIYPWREYAEAGGLVSYGTSLADSYRQVGIYVGKILRGVKPAELPVVQPTRIELVINLRTAKALDFEVSAKILALADAVIE